MVRGGCCTYNCHSYAWYSQSVNPYWIPNPAIYMADESYSLIMSGLNTTGIYAYSNDIVLYGDTENTDSCHSAILISGPTGAPLATRTVRSKWGMNAFLSSSKRCDTNILKEESDAYCELLSRKDAKDVFIATIRNLEKDISNNGLVEKLKMIILNEESFEKILTYEEKVYLNNLDYLD